MKFTVLAASLASAAALVSTNKAMTHVGGTIGPTMWVFGNDGVDIYSTDGGQHIKHNPASEVCHNVTGYRGGGASISCNFYDVVSDGKNYVWAAVSRGVSKIDIFSIDTGDIAGSFETCNSPRDLEYLPLRDEMWVRCTGATDQDGYMNAFSVSSPTTKTPSTIHFNDNTTLSSYGFTAVDNSLGDIAYSTNWGNHKIFKIDLSEKVVLEEINIPNVYGTYYLAYSPVNKHLYLRSQQCCTCGSATTDINDCGRYGMFLVNVTAGPSAGMMNVNGTCRCDGSVADVIGVIEYDTNTDTILGTHVMKEGFGGQPFASPDGKYIVMFAPNGGRSIRVLRAGAVDALSTLAWDLELDFTFEGHEDDTVFSDFAFIQYDGLDVVVFASGTENKIAIVDISSSTPQVSYVSFGGDELSANRRRQVEWAVDTPYVWVDGAALDEAYVFDVVNKKLVNTIGNIKTKKFLFVENYERKRIAALMAQMAGSATADGVASLDAPKDDDTGISAVAIIALVVGALAVIVGIFNLVRMEQNKKAQQELMRAVDAQSLGSKDVA